MSTKLFQSSTGRSAESTNTWRDKLTRIRSAKNELTNYGNLMTGYEKNVIQREIKSKIETFYPEIYRGLMQEYREAIGGITVARARVSIAKKNEVNRWDSMRLNAELQTVKTLAELALTEGKPGPFSNYPNRASRLEGIYSDAIKSGDIYRQRAAFEVIKSIASNYQGSDKAELFHLSKLADDELKSLRVTDEIVKANDEEIDAINAYAEKREEVRTISMELDQGDPAGMFAAGDFAKALKMVQINRETGEINIYDENSPEVTGVYWRDFPDGIYKEE